MKCIYVFRLLLIIFKQPWYIEAISSFKLLLIASITPATEVPEQNSVTSQFTGRRLNSKMQVYSGSKTVHLSKMLTLYEQCIRVLQNNIDCKYFNMAFNRLRGVVKLSFQQCNSEEQSYMKFQFLLNCRAMQYKY